MTPEAQSNHSRWTCWGSRLRGNLSLYVRLCPDEPVMIIVIQRYHIVLEEIITEYSSSNKAVVNYVYIKIGGSVYTNL